VAGLIRVTALASTRRRAGFAFTREPLVLGPESLGVDIAALIALAAILGDPLLLVERSDDDQPDVFIAVSETERAAIIDMATAAELAVDDDEARAAIRLIVEGLIGSADDDLDDEHARALEAKRLADDAEEKRLADEAEAKRLADEAEAKRLADEAEAKRLADEAEAKRLADEADATEPKKGDAAPTEAKAKADAKPQGSSGRQSKPATTTAAKG